MPANKKIKTEESVVVEESVIPIYSLNADCLVKIFEYLPMSQRLSLEKVCKRWREVCELAWNDIRVIEFTELPPGYKDNRVSTRPRAFKISDYMAQILQRCGRYLTRLKLGKYCDQILLPVVARHCENLTRLEIQDSSQYDENRIKLVTQMKKLEYLEIREVVKHFPRDFFQALPHESLTELHLWAGFGKNISLRRIPLLSSPVAADAFYDLSNLTALTLNTFVLKATVMDAISQMSNLTHLSIANCSAQGNLPDLRLLKHLEHLDVRKFAAVDNNFLIQISENCEHLKYLNLSQTNRVNDHGLQSLQKLLHLEELITSFTKITDQSLSGMHALKKLECDHSRVRSSGIIELMRNAPNLEILNLARTQITNRVLVGAARISKRRINDVELRVTVSSSVIAGQSVAQLLHYSPLLRILIDESKV